MKYNELTSEEQDFLWSIHELVRQEVQDKGKDFSSSVYAWYPQTCDLWLRDTVKKSRSFDASPLNIAQMLEIGIA